MELQITGNLPENVKRQFQDLVSQIVESWEKNHASDGSHTGIVGSGNIRMKGIATFERQLKCRLGRAANQTIANLTPTVVQWDAPQHSDATEVDDFYDNGALWSSSPIYNPTQYTFSPPEMGLYLVIAQVRWATGGHGQRTLSIYSGAIEVVSSTQSWSAVAETQYVSTVIPFPDPTLQYTLGATELQPLPFYIEVTHTEGSPVDLLSGTGLTVQVVKVG